MAEQHQTMTGTAAVGSPDERPGLCECFTLYKRARARVCQCCVWGVWSVRLCVRACVRAIVCVRLCVCACVRLCVCVCV